MSNLGEEDRRRLSVAMIVRDAEDVIADTLASVSAIADEIVVADTGSRDDTLAIVKPIATRLLEVPWQEDFSAARNACLQATTGQWVLWLDAGETLSERAAAELRSFVDQHADHGKIYRLLVQLPAAQGSFAGLQVARPRLMPQHPGMQFSGPVHESVDEAASACGLSSETLDVTVVRHESDHLLDVRLRKSRCRLRIAEQALRQNPNDARLLLVRGEALADLGEVAEARQSFQQARTNAQRGSNEMLESYYGELTSYDGDVAHRDMQLDLCVKALETFPVDVQLLCAMGGYLQSQQRIDLAARAYQTAVQYGKVNHTTWHLADIDDIAAICLSIAMELQDRADEARVVLENALTQRRDSVRLRHQVIDLHIRHGRRKEAIEQVGRLPGDWPHRESFANAVRGACLGNEQNWVAAEAYLETAFDAGCRDILCLRWLTLAYSALNKQAAAISTLNQWREIEPDNQEIRKISASIQARRFDPFADGPVREGNEAALPGRSDKQFRIHDSGHQQPAPRPKSVATRSRVPFGQPPQAS